jgi:hypothetical protein
MPYGTQCTVCIYCTINTIAFTLTADLHTAIVLSSFLAPEHTQQQPTLLLSMHKARLSVHSATMTEPYWLSAALSVECKSDVLVKGPIGAQAAGKRNTGRVLVGLRTVVLSAERPSRPEFDDNYITNHQVLIRSQQNWLTFRHRASYI